MTEGGLDLDQVRLSKVRREPGELKLRSDGIEINETKPPRRARARREAVREGETNVAHPHSFESDLLFLREIALTDQVLVLLQKGSPPAVEIN